MAESTENIRREIAEVVMGNKGAETANDEKINTAITELKKNIKDFLDEAKDKEDKILRENALVSAIETVSAESGITILEIVGLLFPEKITYVNEIILHPFGRDLFFEHLGLLSTAEKNPMNALKYADKYKDQPYAEEVIEKAFRSLAEENPSAVLEYADKYKDKPYAEEVIEKAVRWLAEVDPSAALKYADKYKDQPYAEEVIEKAVRSLAEEGPSAALRYADKYKDQPYAEEIIKMMAEKDPLAALEYTDKYSDQPYADEVIEKAVRSLAEKASSAVLQYAGKYKDRPYAEEVIKMMAEKDPWAVLQYADEYKDQPYAKKVIEKAVKLSPVDAYQNLSSIKPFMENSKDSTVRDIYESIIKIDAEKLPQSISKENILILIHFMIKEGLGLQEAANIVSDHAKFIKKMIELKDIPDAIGRRYAEDRLETICLEMVLEINDLHNEDDSIRFASIANSSPEDIYYLITYGEEEVFTSSFNGLFDRTMERLKSLGQSGYDLLEKTGWNKFRIFIKLCSGYGRLDEFLETMDESQKTEVLERFISNLEKSEDFLAEAVIVADTFASLNKPELLRKIQTMLKREYKRVQEENSEEGMRIYGLLAGMFGTDALIDGEWYAEMAKKYEIENISYLNAEELFNPDGSNVQQHFFYQDKDGIASFEHFLETYRNKKDWKIEDRDTFVVITKQKESKKIVIYANKPQHRDGVQAIDEELKKNKVEKIVVVHRGHSYHAGETIRSITPAASIVFLGSCGGYSNISRVLERSQKAHIIATKGTGTMLVNDPLLLMLNEKILTGEDITWQSFWDETESRIGRQKDFRNYIPPHKNLGVMFLKAYEKVKKS